MIRPWNIVLLSMVRSVRSIFRSLPGASIWGGLLQIQGHYTTLFPVCQLKAVSRKKAPAA